MTEPQWINVGTMDDLAEIWPRLVRLTGTLEEVHKVLRYRTSWGSREIICDMRKDMYDQLATPQKTC